MPFSDNTLYSMIFIALLLSVYLTFKFQPMEFFHSRTYVFVVCLEACSFIIIAASLIIANDTSRQQGIVSNIETKMEELIKVTREKSTL